MKNIQMKGIADDLYYKAVEWKGKTKSDSWNDFLAKVVERLERDED